jgi:hypothetical protein
VSAASEGIFLSSQIGSIASSFSPPSLQPPFDRYNPDARFVENQIPDTTLVSLSAELEQLMGSSANDCCAPSSTNLRLRQKFAALNLRQ